MIIESIAVQDPTTRQNEPRVMLFASEPARLKGFGDIKSDGKTVSLADLGPRQVYLNADAADELDAHAGDTIKIFAGQTLSAPSQVQAIVRYDGGATDDSGLLMPLPARAAPARQTGQDEGDLCLEHAAARRLARSSPTRSSTCLQPT